MPFQLEGKCEKQFNTYSIMKNDFISWLNKGSLIVTNRDRKLIGNTLTAIIYTLSDGRVFVTCESALVSYDEGFYMNYSKGDETDRLILEMENKGEYAQGA